MKKFLGCIWPKKDCICIRQLRQRQWQKFKLCQHVSDENKNTKNPQLTKETKGVTTDGNENKKKNVQFQQHKWILWSSWRMSQQNSPKNFCKHSASNITASLLSSGKMIPNHGCSCHKWHRSHNLWSKDTRMQMSKNEHGWKQGRHSNNKRIQIDNWKRLLAKSIENNQNWHNPTCKYEIPNTGRIEMVALALLRHHAIVAAPIWGCDIILHRISGDTHPTDDALGAPFRSLTPFLVCPLGGKFAPREGNLPPGREICPQGGNQNWSDFTRWFHRHNLFGISNLNFGN